MKISYTVILLFSIIKLVFNISVTSKQEEPVVNFQPAPPLLIQPAPPLLIQAPPELTIQAAATPIKKYAKITTGQSLTSANGKFYAKMQDDGNLAIYATGAASSNGKTVDAQLWISPRRAIGVGPWSLIMQEDGNLVIYDSNQLATWAVDVTWHLGVGPYRAVMQNDGNLVLYDSQNNKLWETGTSPNKIAARREAVNSK